MKYSRKPSAKWLIAGLFLSNLVIFLFFLWDLLYLLGFLPWRLATFSKYDWLTVSTVFVAIALVCYLVPNHYTDEDGAPLFPDQDRWQRRTLVGGWGGILFYTALEAALVVTNPDSFFFAQLELLPLVFSGSFLVDLCRSLCVIRRAERDTVEPVRKD